MTVTKRIAFAFFAVVLGTAASLLAGEAMVRLLAPQDIIGAWSVYGPRGLLLNHPNGTGYQRTGDREVTYRFNSFHHRGAEEPRPDARRVLVLGDSFTFGWLLRDEDTYVAAMQRAADATVGNGRIQFLNAAAGGWGTSDMLAYLEAFGPEIRPDMVIVFTNFADVLRSRARAFYRPDAAGALKAYDLTASRSRLKMLLESTPGYQWLREHSQLLQLMRSIALDNRLAGRFEPSDWHDDAGSDDDRALAGALFARMKAWCDQHGARLVVTTTGWPTVDYPWMAEELASRSIDFVDLKSGVADIIGSDPDSFTIPRDGHPNERGADVIAAAAWAGLGARIQALVP